MCITPKGGTDMDYDMISRSARIRKGITQGVTYFFLGVWALLVLFPFYWMVMTSFKSYGAYNGEFIPQLYTLSPTMENYLEAFRAVPLAKYFLNTVIFTVITTGAMLIVTVLADALYVYFLADALTLLKEIL